MSTQFRRRSRPNHAPLYDAQSGELNQAGKEAAKQVKAEIARLKASAPDRYRGGKLYLLRAGRFLKIGFTSGNVADRVKSLQTGSPHPIEVVTVRPGSKDEERALHARFKDLNGKGEWFSESKDIVDALTTPPAGLEGRQ